LACDPRLTRFAQREVQTLCHRQVASWRRSARPAAGPCGPLLRGRPATCLARRRLQRIRLDARSLFGTHHGDMNRVRDSRRGAPSQAAGPSRPLPTPCTCIRRFVDGTNRPLNAAQLNPPDRPLDRRLGGV
jgi:hypothetical protein